MPRYLIITYSHNEQDAENKLTMKIRTWCISFVSSSFSPLSLSITPSLFHSMLKTYFIYKSFHHRHLVGLYPLDCHQHFSISSRSSVFDVLSYSSVLVFCSCGRQCWLPVIIWVHAKMRQCYTLLMLDLPESSCAWAPAANRLRAGRPRTPATRRGACCTTWLRRAPTASPSGCSRPVRQPVWHNHSRLLMTRQWNDWASSSLTAGPVVYTLVTDAQTNKHTITEGHHHCVDAPTLWWRPSKELESQASTTQKN